ncbi:GNAT family N-acetyltransferase [Sphingomonas spermidinifaciens]|uniref:GNAT family N-acetyltransferase n=1 Tax=Sphingomonas spermidinifaciens TaxID=1141889 RepID=A0A2A4AZQ2_9SPHN|nr:N-acetyltransferase [Sphingomonas spermidinifaciens]PCD01651.1 GNAT family N-acetyltransferase [Sphingomonas spermidinifaciens]
MFDLVPIQAVSPAAVEALLDAAFGTDRHGRTAYRLREGVAPITAMSLAAVIGEELVGSIQCWPVRLIRDAGGSVPMILVGPIAVSPAHQDIGIGRALTRTAIERAAEVEGGDAMMLIGDPDYYGRFFGFSAERTGGWRLPGPFEPQRLLALGAGVPETAGEVAPRVSADTLQPAAGADPRS